MPPYISQIFPSFSHFWPIFFNNSFSRLCPGYLPQTLHRDSPLRYHILIVFEPNFQFNTHFARTHPMHPSSPGRCLSKQGVKARQIANCEPRCVRTAQILGWDYHYQMMRTRSIVSQPVPVTRIWSPAKHEKSQITVCPPSYLVPKRCKDYCAPVNSVTNCRWAALSNKDLSVVCVAWNRPTDVEDTRAQRKYDAEYDAENSSG